MSIKISEFVLTPFRAKGFLHCHRSSRSKLGAASDASAFTVLAEGFRVSRNAVRVLQRQALSLSFTASNCLELSDAPAHKQVQSALCKLSRSA